MEHEADKEEGEEYGVRRPERKQEPMEARAEERSEHEETHMHFRSWCRHCVRGRGKEEEEEKGCRETKRSMKRER